MDCTRNFLQAAVLPPLSERHRGRPIAEFVPQPLAGSKRSSDHHHPSAVNGLLQEEPAGRIALPLGLFVPLTYQITFTGYFSKASSPVTIGMFSAMAWAMICRSKGS
jgi:hypothetical protein